MLHYKIVGVTTTWGAGVDYRKYGFWMVGHVILQKLRIQVDLCLQEYIAHFPKIFKIWPSVDYTA